MQVPRLSKQGNALTRVCFVKAAIADGVYSEIKLMPIRESARNCSSPVWVEEPVYRLAQHAFALNGCRLVPWPQMVRLLRQRWFVNARSSVGP